MMPWFSFEKSGPYLCMHFSARQTSSSSCLILFFYEVFHINYFKNLQNLIMNVVTDSRSEGQREWDTEEGKVHSKMSIVLATIVSHWFLGATDSSKSCWNHREPSMQRKKGRNTYSSFPLLLVEDGLYFWFAHSWVPSCVSWVSEHCKAGSERSRVLLGFTWGKLVDKESEVLHQSDPI